MSCARGMYVDDSPYPDVLRHEFCSRDGRGIRIDVQDGLCSGYTIVCCGCIL